MRNRLASVEHRQGARLAGRSDDGLDRSDRPGDVRNVGEGHDLGRSVDHGERLQVDPPVRIAVEPPESGPRPFAQLLPGHEVGVVFGPRDHHAVASPHGQPPLQRRRAHGGSAACRNIRHRVGEEVDRLGRPRGPDELAGVGPDESGNPRARVLECGARLLREKMRSAFDRPVFGHGHLLDGVEDGPRFERGRPRVEVDEPVSPARLAREGREIRPRNRDRHVRPRCTRRNRALPARRPVRARRSRRSCPPRRRGRNRV